LRVIRAIDTGAPRTLRAIGALPPDANRLEYAVYGAADRHRSPHALHTEADVIAALVALRRDLVGAGWLVSAEQRRRSRSGGWLVLGLALLGGLRITAGGDSARPAVLLLTLVVAGAGGALLVVGPRTPAGRRVLGLARRAHPVEPGGASSWLVGAPTRVALEVALHGTAALWAADPVFAAEAGIERVSTGTASYGYGGGFESTVGASWGNR
jgi:uncharacterized protein (TIGR04222 family)